MSTSRLFLRHGFSGLEPAGLRRNAVALLCVAAILSLSGTRAEANLRLINVRLENNINYFQSGGAAPLTPDSYSFQLHATISPAETPVPTLVSVNFPGPASPLGLPWSGIITHDLISVFSTQADLHAAYPFGRYTFTASNSDTGESQQGAIDYNADVFPGGIPALTAQSYGDLQGLTGPLTLHFNSFIPPPFSNDPPGPFATIQFSVFDPITGHVVFRSSVAASATSLLLPVDELLPNTAYGFDLAFRDLFFLDAVNGVFATEFFNVRTNGLFSTGAIPPPSQVPEPGGFELSILAIAGLWCGARRRRSRPRIS